MAQHASVSDLRALWPEAGTLDEARAEVLLPLVSAAIDGTCASEGVDPSGVDDGVLRLVTCQVATRMLATSGGFGVTQTSWGASPFSGSESYANPTGDIYLTKTERQLLGLGAPTCGFVSPKVPE
mgnify:CR=1 FL=1